MGRIKIGIKPHIGTGKNTIQKDCKDNPTNTKVTNKQK